MKELVILGASGQGKVVADIAEKAGYDDIIILDDDPSVKLCGKYKVSGTSEKIDYYRNAEFFSAIGNASIRQKIIETWMNKGFCVATLIHPNAILADESAIGPGSVVMAGAILNPYVTIGKGCIVNTGATVDHDCVVGDYCHISVGTHLAGTVCVGDRTWIGIGAVVSNNISICSDCVVGAGAVVISDISVPGTYVGVPARKIKD